MAVKIRLARAGAKKAPFYRVVAADARAPRDGRFIEILGRYNPRTQPSTVELNVEKIDAWLAKGATPTEAAGKLIAIAKGEKTAPVVGADKPSKKTLEKAKSAAAEAEKAAAAAKAAAVEAAAAKAAAAAAPVEEAVEEPAAEAVAEDADVPAAEEAPAEEAAAEPDAPVAE